MRVVVNIFILILLFEITSNIFSNFLPNYNILIASMNQKNEEQQKLEKIKSIETLLKTVSQRNDIKSLNLSKDYFEIYLPSNFRDYELTAILSQVLKNNGFAYKLVDFNEAEDIDVEKIQMPLIKKVRFSLVVDGSYDKIVSFISDLENNSRIFNIENVLFTKENGNINAKIEISSFYLKPIKILSAVESF